MEISKTIEYTNSLSEKIKNAYKKDIEISINKLFEEFDVYKRGTSTLIKKDELVNIFINPNLKTKYCSSPTKAGTKCKHKALDNSNFCAKHLYSTENLRELLHKEIKYNKNYNDNNNENKNSLYMIESNDEIINKEILQNILIDNSFYFSDSKWIYDKKTMKKVGYIDEDSDERYILSNDPFILNTFN